METEDEARLLQISEHEGRSNSAILQEARDIRLVKEAIVRLEATLAAAKSQDPPQPSVESQQQHISRLQVAIAPHKKLHGDIWTHIFQFTVSDNPEFYEGSAEVLGTSCIKDYTPWKLRLVCSSWRNLISNRPLFWQHIAIQTPRSRRFDHDYFPADGQAINMNNETVKGWVRVVEQVTNLVPTSGPLSIGIRGSDKSGSMFGGGTSLMSTPIGINFMQNIGSRLTNLNVRWCDPSQLIRLLSLPPATFPVLEGLSVNYGWITPDIVFDNIGLFTIPTITRAAVYGSYSALSAILASPDIPWEQYRDVKIYQETEADIFPGRLESPYFTSLIPRLISAVKLSVKIDLVKPETSSTPHALAFDSLKDLHLNTGDVNLVDYFTAPSLRTFDIVRSPTTDDTFNAINSIVNLINRSGCSLQSFHEAPGARKFLGLAVGAHPAEFRALLGLLSDVRDIKLNGVVLGTEEVKKIGTSELLPHARNFDFPCEVPYQEVLDLLQSRFEHGTVERLRARSWTKSPNFKQGQDLTKEYKEKYGVHVDLYY